MLLYHYTSVSTLCSIANGIRDSKLFLRAQNAQNMNDPRDCYYFIEQVGRLIRHATDDDINEYQKEKEKYFQPYLCCLSQHKDDLHMWNCYGDNGKGIAIGIEIPVGRKQKIGSVYADVEKCTYRSGSQIKSDINLFECLQKRAFTKECWQKREIAMYSNRVKHPCYRYEREYRIIVLKNNSVGDIPMGYNKDADAFDIDIPIDKVKSIVVGPMANLEAIKCVFSPFFPRTKFIPSRIPYRT